jgi:hypothetical protein
MVLPDFRNEDEVITFLNTGDDAWCYPMVEEYMELIHVTDEPLDIEELNGWLENELKSATEGYDEWLNNELY